MIKRIVKINNVGRFRNCNCPNIEFKKTTYISALNTYGKSTFCDILKSSNNNLQTTLAERTSIPPLENQPKQYVHYTFTNANNVEKNVKYDNDAWKYDPDIKLETNNIFVFDNKFVEDNIFYGGKIEFENSSNFTNFLISDKAIILQKELVKLKEQQKLNTSELSVLKKSIKSELLSLDEFIKLSPKINLDDCNIQISDEENSLKHLKEAKNSLSQIKTKKIKNNKHIPTYKEKYQSYFSQLNSCLSKSFNELTTEILLHIEKNLNSEKGLQWIIDGTTMTNGSNCPYCGSSLQNNSLINEYAKLLSGDINTFVNKAKSEICLLSFNSIIENTIFEIDKNIQNAKYIEGYIKNTYFSSLLTEIELNLDNYKDNEYKTMLIAERDIAKKITESLAVKQKSPLLKVPEIDACTFETEFNIYEKTLNKIYLQLESLKKLSDEYIDNINIEQIDYDIKQKETRLKELSNIRSYLQQTNLINKYKELSNTAKVLTKSIKEKATELEDTSSEFLKTYHKKVNDLYKQFGSSDFTLDIKISNQGSKQTWKLVPKYKENDVALSDIRNLFSESDKRSLALAVFLAKLEDSELNNKIIILDDPSTSFDDNRIFAVNTYLLNLSHKVKQLIVTSHYGQADSSFKRIFSSEDVSYLAICQTNLNTSILVKNEYEVHNFDSEFKNLYKIAYENKHENIDILKPKIRVFTENYLRRRYKIYLVNNTEQQTLGGIITILKSIPGAITEKQCILYESINRNYSPTHHTYESYNFEDTKLTLISIFEDMKS